MSKVSTRSRRTDMLAVGQLWLSRRAMIRQFFINPISKLMSSTGLNPSS